MDLVLNHNNSQQNFLSEEEIENILTLSPQFEDFWKKPSPMILFRSSPRQKSPTYEVQLVSDLGNQLQTYSWLVIDAFDGRILRQSH